MKFGTQLMRQADDLAAFSEMAGGITRAYLTPQHRQAGDYLIALMRSAGMQAGYDVLGNIVGRYAGATPNAPWLITGSHQDSVRDAGRYDGLYGILSPIACVQALHAQGRRLPYGIEVVGYGDEEGVRFGLTLIGSKALAGQFDFAWLDKADAQGVTLREAIERFHGTPLTDAQLQARIAALARSPAHTVAVVESHIEQGPVLLDEGLPVGVVTAIAGASRLRARVRGLAGHAGTVPMPGRRDALAAAAEMVLAVEQHCAADARLVGTVGKLEVAEGGAINVIPGDVSFTLDLRSGDDAARTAAVQALRERCDAIAARRRVALEWTPLFASGAAPCDARLQAALAASVAAHGVPVRHLPSGAGHDAMSFHGVLPQGMLFVRCGNGGISHNPLETMTAEDAELSTQVLLHFFEHFDAARFLAA